MANTIITKNSSTAASVPSAGSLTQGELAVNVTDKRLYTKDSGGNVVEVGTNPSTMAVAGNATVGGTLGVTGVATLTANPVLSAGTANGLAFLNASKVLTSGSALTFDGTSVMTMTASDLPRLKFVGSTGGGNGWIDTYGTSLRLVNNTASGTTSIQGNGQIDLSTAGGYPIVFTTSGSEQMRLTSTGLGIGTSSPGVKLDVSGQGRILYGTGATNTGDQSVLTVGAVTTGAYASSYGAGLQFQITNSGGGYSGGRIVSRLGADNFTANLVFQARNYGFADSMVLNSSGNLGLGVTPSAWSSKAFETGYAGSAVCGRAVNTTDYTQGAYFNSGWKYANSSYAPAVYEQQSGAHYWLTAPSGTAGNAISFTQAMTLDASGRLLIGLTSSIASNGVAQIGGNADTRLIVDGSSTQGIYFTKSGADNGTFRVDGSGNYNWFVKGAGSANMTLDASGRLGVGRTSPSYMLDVENATQADMRLLATGNVDFLISSIASGLEARFTKTGGAGPITFYNGGSERARIDSSGNLLRGQTISGNTNGNGFYSDTAGYFGQNHINGTASGAVYAYFGYNGATIGSITQNGTTGVLYNLTSDYRLKNNPVALTGAKAFVMALQPKTWDWWDGSGKGVGFIAHEFMEVAKYSGNGTKDEVDAEGKPVYQSIQPSSSEVMANLVALIQEQQAIIESLKARLDAANL